jgi:hypothetical protein
MLGMDRFETRSMALLPGQRVQARILRHEPWGVLAQIIGHEHVGASIDMIEQFGALLDQELEATYPPAGSVIDAVVEQVRRWYPPAWVRLSIRPRDLELLRWPCGFCGEPVVLSPRKRRSRLGREKQRRPGRPQRHFSPRVPGGTPAS